MNAQDIIKKLQEIGLTRKEIAEQIGISLPALNGYMAKNAPRPVPEPVHLLLQKVWAELQGEGEIRFSYQEHNIIARAIPISGCKNFNEFAHNTIIAKARELVSNEEGLLNMVADDTQASSPNSLRTHFNKYPQAKKTK